MNRYVYDLDLGENFLWSIDRVIMVDTGTVYFSPNGKQYLRSKHRSHVALGIL